MGLEIPCNNGTTVKAPTNCSKVKLADGALKEYNVMHEDLEYSFVVTIQNTLDVSAPFTVLVDNLSGSLYDVIAANSEVTRFDYRRLGRFLICILVTNWKVREILHL